MKRLIVVLAAALIASLAPAVASPQPAAAANNGLSSAQRAALRAIARDTWQFYGVDVDPTTALPMDNVTFAGRRGDPDRLRPLHLGGQHRRLPVGGGRGLRPRPDQPAGRPATRIRGHAHRGRAAAPGSTASCTSGTTPRPAT